MRAGYYWAVSGAGTAVAAFASGLAMSQRWEPASTPDVLAALATYVIVAPLSLGLIATAAHKGMSRGKRSTLEVLHPQIWEAFNATLNDDNGAERFKRLRETAEYFQQARTWPFAPLQQLKIVGALAVSLLTATLAAAVGTVVKARLGG